VRGGRLGCDHGWSCSSGSRRDRRVEGLSIRELATRHGVHRRTVREALASALLPPPRKAYARRYRPAMDGWAEVVDGWLLGDREVPRKQRHTARRIWQRLVAEHGAGLSEVTVSRYVARRRVELGLDRVEVMVPQAHLPGIEAQVDFGEFQAFTRPIRVYTGALAGAFGPLSCPWIILRGPVPARLNVRFCEVIALARHPGKLPTCSGPASSRVSG
jgi:hypothetical protein